MLTQRLDALQCREDGQDSYERQDNYDEQDSGDRRDSYGEQKSYDDRDSHAAGADRPRS